MFKTRLLLLLALLCGVLSSHAQETVALLQPRQEKLGWTYSNGQEFPGATGSLAVDAEKRDGREVLKLSGDFARGGKYVAALTKIPDVDIRELALWVQTPDDAGFKIRLEDATGQTHQIALRTEKSLDWQRVVLPLEQFFARRGQADAPTVVTKYEYWGGSKDGNWHGPARSLVVLLGSPVDRVAKTLKVADVTLTTRPLPQKAAMVTSVVRLDELTEGETDWKNGADAKTKNTLEVVKDQPQPGMTALKFSADMSNKGTSARIVKSLADLDLADITAIRMKVKSETVTSYGLVLVDGTGQTHQRRGNKIAADGQWHDLVIEPAKVAGGEHWGGANDGAWHGAPGSFAITFNATSDPATGKPVLWISDMTADAVQAGVAQAASFKSDFEAADSLAKWTSQGTVALDGKGAFKGAGSLAISRVTNGAEKPAQALSPAFAVTPGQWQFAVAAKSDLKSPDSSYSGTVEADLMDGGGKVLQSVVLVDVFGTRPWAPAAKAVDVPRGITQARFRAQLNKADGTLWIDEVSAAFLAPAPRKDRRVARLMFGLAQMGNMLLPKDPKTAELIVYATKPLQESQQKVTYEVRDYWGAEQAPQATAALVRDAKRSGDYFVYRTTVDLAPVPLEVGRYYELHGEVPQLNSEPFVNYTSFVIEPEAATRAYKPEEIPFTSRSWDNRSEAHIRLGDRLGIRIAGIKAGWDSKAPYKPSAPRLEIAKELGMGWLTTTPVATIERGLADYDEAALRGGVRNLIEKYGDTRPLFINIGNEPHGVGDVVTRNVAAYKAIYEEVKKTDPSITVIATSVEPNEEYFKAGYGKYCDAYDFHVYGTPESIRSCLEQYRALMKKYDVVHPVWSTEIGLNAQGLPTYAIANDMIRKVTTFFAAGGTNIGWFGLCYADPNGTIAGTSGEAHNVFDSRYNRYAPKMQAVSYYNIINAIGVKKFVAEKHYEGGVNAFLFRDRDGKALQVLWKDKGRQDVALPLGGVQGARLVRLDGSIHPLDAGGKAVSVSVSEDPVLVLYDGGPAELAPNLGAPLASFEALPASMTRGASAIVSATLNGVTADAVNLVGPAGWTVKKLAGDARTARFTVGAPEDSDVREADMTLQINAGGKRAGELYARAPVAGRLALQLLPVAAQGGKPAAVKVLVTNNGTEAQYVSWDLSLGGERTLAAGAFGALGTTMAHFATAPAGSLAVEPGKTAETKVELADVDAGKIYRVRAVMSDAAGRTVAAERFIGGLVAVPRTRGPLKMDGVLDEEVWKNAPMQTLDRAEQMRIFKDALPWKGAADLSARLRFAWDETNLYIAADVTDDIAGGLKADADIWSQDGLQLLFDPSRDKDEKAGKYDYGVAVGSKGPQAWAFLVADTGVTTGEAPDITVGVKQGEGGSKTYEIAMPWKRLAPFKPQAGGNLGLSLAVNEDDGKGRRSFMTWFGDVQTKQVDTVGDLILGE